MDGGDEDGAINPDEMNGGEEDDVGPPDRGSLVDRF